MLRDIGVLLYVFLLFLSYLDNGHEPMSVDNRIVAGALVLVLTVGSAAARMMELFLASAASPESAAALQLASAQRFFALIVAAGLLSIALVPRLFRRSVFLPLARLTGAVTVLERGGRGALEVDHEDDIKVMAQGTAREHGVRFAREAEIAAGLAHENLVGVLDVGLHDGIPYLVMERVDGASLEDARDRFGDVPWAVPLLAQIAEGLTAKPPFAVPAVLEAMAGRAVHDPPALPDDLAPSIGEALRASVSSDPAARPSARALRSLLAGLARGEAGALPRL